MVVLKFSKEYLKKNNLFLLLKKISSPFISLINILEEFLSRFFISCLYKNFDFGCLCFSNSLYNQLFTVWWVILNDNFFFIFIEILLHFPSIPYIYLLPLSLKIFYFWRHFCFSFSFECLKSVPVFPTGNKFTSDI